MSIAAVSQIDPLADVSNIWFKRFSVAEYHRMIDAGVLAPEEPVELLDGRIIRMGHNPPHDVVVKLVSQILDRALPDRFHTRVQSAITMDDSEPLPDIAIVRGRVRDYLRRHPGPADVALLVEVSDTSLQYDRRAKAAVYARAGIALYWVINLIESQIEVYTLSSSATRKLSYRKPRIYRPGESISISVGGVAISVGVREVLP